MRRNGIRTSIIVFYTFVRRFSRGKVLARLFEFQSEVKRFLLKQNKHEWYKHVKDDHWIAKLGFMAAAFELTNEPNTKMQETNENILTFSDQLHEIQQKLLLWKNELRLGSLEMFPRSYKNQKMLKRVSY